MRLTAPRGLRHGTTVPLTVQIGLLVAALGVVLDQATKEVAEARLAPGEFVPWLGSQVGWQLVYNPGGAFGVGTPPWVFLIVTILVVAIVARTLPTAAGPMAATAYGLLLSGAVGNLTDRVLRPGGDGLLDGHVVDFVAWGAWPRFNVADSAITVGFVLLVVALVREERQRLRAPDGDAAGASSAHGDREASPFGDAAPPEGEGAVTVLPGGTESDPDPDAR